MEPESPDNERQRKIDEAVESGNHELREMARLAYNRGDKDLARNIWRTLTDSQGDESKSEAPIKQAPASGDPAAVPDKDLEVARKAEVAAEEARQSDAPAVYASAKADGSGDTDTDVLTMGDAVTGSDAMSSGGDSIGSSEIINPAPPGSDLV